MRPFSPFVDTFTALPALSPDETRTRVYACPRGLYMPLLHVRPARVEDHDDLEPVFNAQSEVLSDRYGQFFIAELIENQVHVELLLWWWLLLSDRYGQFFIAELIENQVHVELLLL